MLWMMGAVRCLTVLCFTAMLYLIAEGRCPPQFTNYNMACYYIGANPVYSADSAFETCYALGGYLLNINAKLENDYIMDQISKQPTIYDGYWIGGFYNGKYWMWQKIDSNTGKEVEIFMNPKAGYYQWGPFQPDDGLKPLFSQYNVAIMTRGRVEPYQWYSENGGLRTPNGIGYICEADWKE